MASFNIHKKYDWTSIPRESPLRSEAPVVKVESFRLNANQVQQAITNFLEVIPANFSGVNSGNDFYDQMYKHATIAEDTFFFPYFSDTIRQFSNNFSDSFQSGIGGVGGFGNEVMEKAKQLIGGVASIEGVFGGETKTINIPGTNIPIGIPLGKPGVYVETPMFYQYEKNDGPVEVTFVLSNTIHSDSLEKNFMLIRKLTEINRPFRENSITVHPPRIYRITIKGHRFIRWASCASFSVTMLGARRLIDDVMVPEGYLVSMSFQSLTLEHAGFLNQVGFDPTLDVRVPSDIPSSIRRSDGDTTDIDEIDRTSSSSRVFKSIPKPL